MPIYVQNTEANETFGMAPAVQCAPCYSPVTRTRFWGLCSSFYSTKALASGISPALRHLKDHRYRLVHRTISQPGAPQAPPHVLAVSDKPPTGADVVKVDIDVMDGAAKVGLSLTL